MRTKNAAPITPAEAEHMANVKRCSCVLCDAPPPSAAHHPIQGLHLVTAAVCDFCHQGPMGIHGDGTMLRLRYGTNDLRAELRAVNETLRRVAALENA
jgi:hypothetical protein